MSRKNKYFVEARDSKGRFLSRRKWTQSFNNQAATKKLLQDNTFKENEAKRSLTNVVEITRSGRQARPQKGLNYQVEVIFKIKGLRTPIIARSMQHASTFPIRQAAREAEESALERLGQLLQGQYDKDVGQENLDKVTRIEEKLVFYRAKNTPANTATT